MIFALSLLCRFMTVACSTILVGVFNRPRLFAVIAQDAAVGVLKDISFDFSVRFEVAFSWPSDLPTPNLMQLGLSLCMLAAKYAFVIFTLIMKYMIGHDRGAALLNESVVSLPSAAVDLTVFGLARAIATAQQASKLTRIVRRLLRGGKVASGSAEDNEDSINGSASKTDATAVREFELSIAWVSLCTTVGAPLASSMARQFSTKRLRLDLRDPPGQSNKDVLKSRDTLLHALGCDDEIDVQGRLSDGALGKLVESSCGKQIAHLDLASCACITAEGVKVVTQHCSERLESVDLTECSNLVTGDVIVPMIEISSKLNVIKGWIEWTPRDRRLKGGSQLVGSVLIAFLKERGQANCAVSADLSGSKQISNEGMKALAKCGDLVSLNLANCGVDGERCWTTKSCLHCIRQLKLSCRRTPT